MIIPFRELQPETLTALIESFIHREGTDYGWEEVDLATKVAQVKRQLEAGEIAVVYDEETESVNLLPRHSLNEFLK